MQTTLPVLNLFRARDCLWVGRRHSPARELRRGIQTRKLTSRSRESYQSGRAVRTLCSAFDAPSRTTSTDRTSSTASTSSSSHVPRICVLGGGFGGLYTALKLDALRWPDARPKVTLVDQNDSFVFKPLLYELLNGGAEPWEVAPKFADLLGSSGVEFVQARVTAVEPTDGPEGSADPAGRVLLDHHPALEYDWLVLSLGAEARFPAVAGVRENAVPFATLEDAQRVDERLRALEARVLGGGAPPRVAVIGGGLAGMELAATVAERLGTRGSVQVVTSGDTVMRGSPAGQRKAAVKVVRGHGAELLTRARVTGLDPDPAGQGYTLRLADDRHLPCDLVLWTAGQTPVVPASGVSAYGLPLAEGGEAAADQFLRVVDRPRMYALGDAAYAPGPDGAKLPATAQVAFQAADYVAWNIWAEANKKTLLPFKYQHLGDMMALGGTDAAVAFPVGDLTLDGPAASLLRKAAYVYRQPTLDHAVKVGLSWLTKPFTDILGPQQ